MKQIMFGGLVPLLCAITFAGDDRIATPKSLVEVGIHLDRMSKQIAALQSEVETLKDRIAESEQGGVTGSPSQSAGSSAVPVVQLLSFEQLPVDYDKLDRADALEEEATLLDDDALDVERQRAESVAGGKKASRSEEARREQLKKEAFELRERAKDKRSEAARLRREANTRRQRIIGWDGQREVFLETERDLSVHSPMSLPGPSSRGSGSVSA